MAGLFLGLGGFQLFDGIADHKLLRLHQIRYGDNVLGWDLARNRAALFDSGGMAPPAARLAAGDRRHRLR